MPWWVGCTRLHMHSSIASLNWDNTWRWIWERLPWEIKAVLRRAGAPAQISKQVWQVWWLVQPIESRTMTVWRAKKLNCDAFKQNTVNAPVVEAGNQDHRCAKGTRQFIIDRATCVAVSRRRWCGAEGQWLSWTTEPLGGVGSAPCLRQWVKSWFQHSVFLGDTVANSASMCDWKGWHKWQWQLRYEIGCVSNIVNVLPQPRPEPPWEASFLRAVRKLEPLRRNLQFRRQGTAATASSSPRRPQTEQVKSMMKYADIQFETYSAEDFGAVRNFIIIHYLYYYTNNCWLVVRNFGSHLEAQGFWKTVA